MKKYLIGDSHSGAMRHVFSKYVPEIEWMAILGYGLQGYVQNSPGRNLDSGKVDIINSRLSSLERGSRIFLSYTEVDARIGMIDVGHQTILEDYKLAINEIFNRTSAQELIILDWYGILDRVVPEQSCSPRQRIKNRTSQLEALDKISQSFPLKISTSFRGKLEDSEGFNLDSSLVPDGVHYNFSSEKLSFLFKEIEKYE